MGIVKSIVLITSGQPSANPRLVKEATALANAGFRVTVIYVPISPWADQFDEQLMQQYPEIRFVRTGYHSIEQSLAYKWVRARRKLLFKLWRAFGDVLNLADYSTILFGQELLKEAKRHKADLYIAHNLGALPVAVKAAMLNNAKIGFDAEDFHRGEFAEVSNEQYITSFIESKYFKELDYLTVASPLIGDAYNKLFPDLSPVVLNNVFPLKLNLKIPDSENDGTSLKLFWFSQIIGKKRGIENVIRAIGLVREFPVILTLLGNITQEMKAYFLSIATNAGIGTDKIKFIAPVSENEIFRIASEHDVGLCSEVPYCLNREYCLTNKVFTYLTSGVALAMSDTKAQSKFVADYPNIGKIYKSEDSESLALVLKEYLTNPGLLEQHKLNAGKLAQKLLNWDLEKVKFLKLVRSTVNS